MSKTEKENRINSLAVAFLEKQQIQPNIFADQIIRGYKEGYHQAEKDNELTWKDIKEICTLSVLVEIDLGGLVSDERHYTEVLKRFKAQKGEEV